LGTPVLAFAAAYFFGSGAFILSVAAGAAAGAGATPGVVAGADAAALVSAGFDSDIFESAGLAFLLVFFFAVFFFGASLLAFIDESVVAVFASDLAGAVAAGGVGAGVVAGAGAVPCAETPIVHALAINAVKSFFIVGPWRKVGKRRQDFASGA
jgi:hypothetical protein